MANKEEKAARHEKVESFKKELRTAAGINMKLAEITEKVKASDWSVDYKVVESCSPAKLTFAMKPELVIRSSSTPLRFTVARRFRKKPRNLLSKTALDSKKISSGVPSVASN